MQKNLLKFEKRCPKLVLKRDSLERKNLNLHVIFFTGVDHKYTGGQH